MPNTAFAVYRSDSDTGVEQMDYLENEHRNARENALTDEQKQLLKDTADMKKNNRVPVDPKKASPAAIEGDDLFYDMNTGDALAKGHVRITQEEGRRFITDEAKGNLKTHDIYIEGKMHALQLVQKQSSMIIDGYKTAYNYETQTGSSENVSGKVDHQYITGKRMEFYPDKVIIYDGTTTKCSAQSPDYHWQANKIEIYPHKQMIMYDVKAYIKHMNLYHKDRVIVDISPGAKDSMHFPKVGYNSSDGFWIRDDRSVPLIKNVTANADFVYLSHHNFRSKADVTWRNGGNTFTLDYGFHEDSDDHWIKKQPSFIYSYTNRVGHLPFSYTLNYEVGHWYNNNIRSTHRYYGINLSRDVIRFHGWRLSLGVGYGVTKETYNDSTAKGYSFSSLLMKDFNSKFTGFIGYSYSATNSQTTLFNYNVDDYARKLEYGFSLRLTDRDRLVVGENYDMEAKKLKDVDYYWYHDMHCAQLVLRYRAKRPKDRWHIGLQFTPW